MNENLLRDPGMDDYSVCLQRITINIIVGNRHSLRSFALLSRKHKRIESRLTHDWHSWTSGTMVTTGNWSHYHLTLSRVRPVTSYDVLVQHSYVRQHKRSEESRAVPFPWSWHQKVRYAVLFVLCTSPPTVRSIQLQHGLHPKLLANLKHNQYHSSPRFKNEPWFSSIFNQSPVADNLYLRLGGQ